MSNTPCTRPELCGVQTHRPGTVALCMTASGKGGSASTGNLSGVPTLSSTPASGIDYSELDAEETAEAVVDHHGIYVANAHNEGLQKDDYGWEHTRWELELEAQNGEKFNYIYLTGKNHGDRTPQPEQVVETMIDNARMTHRYDSPMAYGYELGYDLDDPEEMERTKKSFEGCKQEAETLKRVIGEDEYQRVVFADPTTA